MRPKLTHVAIRFQGKVYSLPPPNRHHNIIRLIVDETGVSHVDSPEEDQGFLDETGRFLNRKQAFVSAELNGQLLPDIPGKSPIIRGILFSENLW